MKHLSKDQFDHLVHLSDTNQKEALILLLEYEKQYTSDVNLAPFFIDIGSDLRDISIIQRGVDYIETERRRNNGILNCMDWYNLGNGYYAIESAKRGTGYKYNPASTTMVQAKQCYREALKDAHNQSQEWQTDLHTNYANCLGELGRSLEAINEYGAALQITPNHSIALGNLGKTLEKFAHVAHDISLLKKALWLFDKVLSNERLEEAGVHERSAFEADKKRIEELLKQLDRKDDGKHKKPHLNTPYHQSFVEFCVEHSLFLNFCLKGQTCNHPYEDNIGFSVTTPISDQSIFHRLVRTTNEIKETFAIARLLLFEAFDSPYETIFYDTVTPYWDILDYSVYGIRSAKLKLSFTSAYNILDRIALFINEYLNLRTPEPVSIMSIWKSQKKDDFLKPEIIQCDNIHLYALYDIARDLLKEKDNHLHYLKEMRDNLTHIYLVPHSFQDGEWYATSDNPKCHIGYKEFFDHTITLMQIVRAAVIYLVAFIDEEERKRMFRSKTPAFSTGTRRHKPSSFGPKDSLI